MGIVVVIPAQVQGRVLILRFAVVTKGVCAKLAANELTRIVRKSNIRFIM